MHGASRGTRCTSETLEQLFLNPETGGSPWGWQSVGGNWNEAKAGISLLFRKGSEDAEAQRGRLVHPMVTQQVSV